MNDITYREIRRILMMKKQVIVFVHKRADTINTAKELIDILRNRSNDHHLFDCENSYKMDGEVKRSRNEQVKELF